MPAWLTSHNDLVPQGLGELAWLAKLCFCCHILFLGELSIVFVTPLGEDYWCHNWFPMGFAYAPFVFVDFILYTFSVISHSHIYNISEGHTRLEKCNSFSES